MLLSAGMMACQTAYKPDFCDIVNVDKLSCKPTDSSKDPYELSTLRALGYRCVSPDDWREGKKRIRQSLEIDDVFNEHFRSILEGENND